jgi:hypothetical protein
MYSFFLVTAGLGAAVLVLQIVLSLVGVDSDASGDVDIQEGLDLLSVRSLSAGAAAFGLAGLAVMEVGLPGSFALILGGLLGIGAAVLTAWLTMRMLRLDQSGSLHMEGAVGCAGMVRISIPGNGDGAGRVQFELQGRTLEMKAVSPEGPIATGTAVTIVGLVDGETVEVVPTPTLKEIIG